MLVGAKGKFSTDTSIFSEGDDTYSNRKSNTVLSALAGNDSVYNSANNVTIDGGAGNDYIRNSGDYANINGGTDNDIVYNYNGDNSYIEQAFTYARKYAPQGTKLFYNDFNEYIPAKRDAIYNMISDLKSKNLIDGVGMQSHLDVGYPDANLYQQCIEKYSQLGLEIQITELDITQYKSNGDLSKQTQAYHDIVKTIIDQKKAGANITALVFWGITDGTSWRKDGLPLLLNSDYSLKDSYTQVESLIPQEEWGKADETQPTETEPTTEEIILPPGSYIPGDVNLDKKVNIYDLILLKKKILAGDTAILYYENRESDVNHDGVINLSDIILLQKYLLGLIDTFD